MLQTQQYDGCCAGGKSTLNGVSTKTKTNSPQVPVVIVIENNERWLSVHDRQQLEKVVGVRVVVVDKQGVDGSPGGTSRTRTGIFPMVSNNV